MILTHDYLPVIPLITETGVERENDIQ